MDVSVIIVNYNTRKLTGECIDSIFEKTSGITFEVIVVDNASQDDSIEIFRKDPRIIFIENTENQGFGKANNLGILYIGLFSLQSYYLDSARCNQSWE